MHHLWSETQMKKVKEFKIKCNDHVINSQSKIKYLGIDIDQNLSGEITVNSIIKKVNSRLKFMYRKQAAYQRKLEKLLQRL